MTTKDLIYHLIEFYQQCSNRGWCKVKTEKGEFVTVYSSETNFTHLPLVFGRLPKKCIISPKLALKNIGILKSLLLEFDSQRLISVTPKWFTYEIRITGQRGEVIKSFRIRRYTSIWLGE